MSYTDETSQEKAEGKNVKTPYGKTSKEDLNTSAKKSKYQRRFCTKWLIIFNPWLTRCDDNPNRPFCRACQCCLDCNRFHLQRHERTSKHARNLKIFIRNRQERNKYQQRKKRNASIESASDSDMGTTDDVIKKNGENEIYDPLQIEQAKTTSSDKFSDKLITKQYMLDPKVKKITNRNYNNNHGNASDNMRSSMLPIRSELMKILMQIQRDKKDLMDSIKKLIGNAGAFNQINQSKEKHNVDLFFDSAKSSVKALTPKLIAEAKIRISQLIGELELRALTETDVNGASIQVAGPKVKEMLNKSKT